MSAPAEQPKWHPNFSPGKDQMVILQDERGTLYQVPAGVLAAQSSFFKVMFASCTDTGDPIKAGFKSDWLPQLLQYGNMIHCHPALGRSQNDATFDLYLRHEPAASLASLYLWCRKFEADDIADLIRNRAINPLMEKPDSPSDLVAIFRAASDAESIELFQMVCDVVEMSVQTDQKLVEAITDVLRPEWKEAFLLSLCKKLIDPEDYLGDDFERRVMEIGRKNTSGERSRSDDAQSDNSEGSASAAKKARIG